MFDILWIMDWRVFFRAINFKEEILEAYAKNVWGKQVFLCRFCSVNVDVLLLPVCKCYGLIYLAYLCWIWEYPGPGWRNWNSERTNTSLDFHIAFKSPQEMLKIWLPHWESHGIPSNFITCLIPIVTPPGTSKLPNPRCMLLKCSCM